MEGEDSGPGLEGDPYPLRTVVIHRGERGYGVTVSGESPVIVQDVKDGKAFSILLQTLCMYGSDSSFDLQLFFIFFYYHQVPGGAIVTY